MYSTPNAGSSLEILINGCKIFCNPHFLMKIVKIGGYVFSEIVSQNRWVQLDFSPIDLL